MLNRFSETLINIAVGTVAMYIVGRVAFQAGKDVAAEEFRCSEVRRRSNAITDPNKTTEIAAAECKPQKKQSKLGMLFGATKIFGNRNSVLGNLISDPESHKVEASVEGDELQIRVKRKEVS